jgi:endonuclease/exonuclease/phosphatase (EEP) superfamily protein YafD
VEGAGDILLKWLKHNKYTYEYLPFGHFGKKSMGVLTAVKKINKPKFQSLILRSDNPRLFRPFKNIRGLVSTKIKINGKTLSIVNTHLTYPRLHTIDMRKREFISLKSHLIINQTDSVFLCGDFNFLPIDNRRSYLKKHFANFSGGIIKKTWKHGSKYSLLRANADYLFWDESRLNVEAKLIDFNTSDHRPLYANIKNK